MELLSAVGLEGMEDRRPTELSGGQQQRVAIARAIAAEPALVLADEPTANVDSETAESLITLMERLNEERGVTATWRATSGAEAGSTCRSQTTRLDIGAWTRVQRPGSAKRRAPAARDETPTLPAT